MCALNKKSNREKLREAECEKGYDEWQGHKLENAEYRVSTDRKWKTMLINQKEKLASERGITLFALILTVVIMIILATVTINITLGDGGLIDQAKHAAEATVNSTQTEQQQMDDLASQLNDIIAGIGGGTGGETNTVPGGDTNQIEETNTIDTNTVDPDPVPEPLPDNTITIGEPQWQPDGTANITVSSTEPDVTIEYQIGGTEEGSWIPVSGGTITGIKNGEIVYVRITDGEQASNPQSTTVQDATGPVVTVGLQGTATTNSISVSVSAEDKETGMADSLTYTYYIKESTQGDESYTAPEGATGITQNTYTFNNLKAGTSYDIKVEVNGDKAGNPGTGFLTGQQTGTIPGGEEGVERGKITFGPANWADGKASVTIATDTGLQLQYQINAIEENGWTPIDNNGTISNLEAGDTVYARLTDGNNYGDYASTNILDNEAPAKASIQITPTSLIAGEALAATVTHSDTKSGVDMSASKWVMTQSEAEIGTGEDVISQYTGSFTTNGAPISLDSKTTGTFYLHVLTVDNAGNRTETVSEAITINGITGEVSKTGEITWSDGTASLALETDSQYDIEYRINNTGEWQKYEGTITNLSHGDTVTARLTNGTTTGPEVTFEVKDETGPVIKEVSSSKTTNSVTLEVTATDNETGLPDTLNYTFEIKQSSEPDSSYEQIQTGTNTTATKDGLEQGTRYTVRVTLQDKVGNIGTFTKDIITDRVGGATGGLEEGNIVASKPQWQNGTASITLTTSTGYQIQWQKVEQGAMMGSSWNDYEGAITGLNHGDTVYARLWDGTNAGQEASVNILDGVAPQAAKIDLSGTTASVGDSITATVTMTDNESGINAKSCKWVYNTTAENIGTEESSYTETFETNPQELTLTATEAGTYYLHVLSVDNAGNKVETVSEAVTVSEPMGVDDLTAGNWVRYEDGTGVERDCVVLYDSSSEYGVEIITMETVEDVELGDASDLDKAMEDYNNAISILNNATSKYNNLIYSDASRSVGSDPSNPTLDNPGYFTRSDSWFSSYNEQFKNADTNYTTDNNQMEMLGIRDIGKEYLLASRAVGSYSDSTMFEIRIVDPGNAQSKALCWVKNDDTSSFISDTGLRPVFHLRDTVTISGGSGTQEDPYTLYAPPPPSIDDIKPNPDEDGEKVENTTTITDDLDNEVVIPGGFHLASDSGTTVEEGIVIEDDAGNQFVWIPTGTYNVSNSINSSKKLTNNLSRRTFTTTGATEVSGDSVIGSYYYGEGDSRSVAYNQIGAFKESANKNGGFYIGRYELGTGNVVKAGVAPYTNITRDQAKSNIENMYKGNSYVTSELISSYAWDTALNFICQTNVKSGEGYNLGMTTSSQYGNIGTNKKENTGAYAADNYSNIHDLLGNCYEWTTEYCSFSDYPCVFRGGYCISSSYYAALRRSVNTSYSDLCLSARAQLYIGNSGSTTPTPTEPVFNLTVQEGEQKDTLTVTVQNDKGIQKIELVTQEETREYNNSKSVTESFDILENGDYTVKVTYSDGSTEEKSITISNLNFDPIARIGQTEYDSLTKAVNAVPAGTKTTIEIIKDFEQSLPVYIPANKDVVIDLKGNTVTLTTGYLSNLGTLEIASSTDANGEIVTQHKEKVCIANSGATTISSGKITAPSTNAIRNNESGSLTIAGGTVVGQGENLPTIANYAGSTISVSGGKVLSVESSAIYNVSSVNMTMSSGTVESTNGNAINNQGNSTVNITGGEVKGSSSDSPTIWNTDGTVTIANANITATNSNVVYNDAGTINANSGTVSATGSSTNSIAFSNAGSGTININGGTVTSTRSAVVNQGSGEVEIDGATITETGNENPVVINQAGGTIRVVSGTISSDNNNVIYNSANGNIIVQGGELTGTGASKPTIWNGAADGTVTIEAGTIRALQNQTANVYNKGKLIVSGGNVEGDGSNAIRNDETGTATITEGTLTAKDASTIYHNSTTDLLIQGGTITETGEMERTVMNTSSGEIIVSNATISTELGRGISNDGTGTITVNSGNITTQATNQPAVWNDVDGAIVILGGTLSSNANAVYNNGTGSITIGVDDGNVSTTSPDITSPNNYYTVYSDTLNYYDGILRGGGINDQAVVTTPAGKQAVRNTSGEVYYTTLN